MKSFSAPFSTLASDAKQRSELETSRSQASRAPCQVFLVSLTWKQMLATLLADQYLWKPVGQSCGREGWGHSERWEVENMVMVSSSSSPWLLSNSNNNKKDRQKQNKKTIYNNEKVTTKGQRARGQIRVRPGSGQGQCQVGVRVRSMSGSGQVRVRCNPTTPPTTTPRTSPSALPPPPHTHYPPSRIQTISATKLCRMHTHNHPTGKVTP